MSTDQDTIEPVPPARCDEGAVGSNTYPTHRTLTSVSTGCIVAAMDCYTGRVLRVFDRHYAVGSIVQTGSILSKKSGKVDVGKKFWVVTGHSSWQSAKAMARKCGDISANAKLKSGVWHEVISE